ncbi:MAG: CHAT domain-containing protein [Bacteroidota bacterium]
MMRTPVIIIVIILAALLAPMQADGQSGGTKSFRALRKLYSSKDPDKLRQSILELSQNAKDKSNFRQYILFQLLLGDQYERAGDYLEAEKSLMEAYNEAKKHLPAKHGKFKLSFFRQFSKTIFDPIDRLGYFYLTIGNLRTAEQYFIESKNLRDSFFPPRSIHRVHPIVGMGSWYFRKGDYVKTYELFNQATREINRSMTTGYDFDNLRRLFLNDLTEICFSLGKNEEAIDYINQLAIASSGAAKFSSKVSAQLEVARIFELKARYYLFKEDYLKAKEYLDKADWYNPAKISYSDVKFKLIKTRALLEWNQGHSGPATDAFLQLVREYRKHIAYNFGAMSEYEKEQFYYLMKNDFDLYNAYVLSRGEEASTVLHEEMYNNVLNTKALLLSQANRQKNKILEQGDPVMIAKLRDWEETKARLAAQYYEKGNAVRLDSMERYVESLEKELNRSVGLFAQNQNPLTWQQIRLALGAKEAAAEVLRVRVVSSGARKTLTDSVVYAILQVKQGSGSPQVYLLSNGNQLENHFLPNYRNSILFRVDDKLSYDQFWAPIKKQLTGIQRFYLSLDGVYNQINLNTLRNTVTNQYVIDELQMVYLTNTSDLLRPENRAASLSAVLVGRPTYDFEAQQEAKVGERAYGTRNLINQELETFKDQEFEDLPGTEAEISMIEPILKKQNLSVQTLLGKDALEETIKKIHHPSIVHIATHGFFVDDAASTVSPMIRSGIVLAGIKKENGNQDQDDGILTAYEATNLDLEGTSLVVLSACKTGLGEVRNGEGVYGLQRAIVVAGASNLIMSLWKVDDEATAELMASFYKVWTGKNNEMEFREAQMNMRKKYPQPFYWGAFVMLGK